MDFGYIHTRSGWRRPNAVYPDLCRASQSSCPAQILLVMPSAEEYRAKDSEQVERELSKVLQEKVAASIEAGYTEFEIQLIQNVDSLGYVNGVELDSRQGLVTQWGSAAYRAIGALHEHLTAMRGGEDSVVVDATMGSNGAAVFARNYAIWMTYLDRVDLFDGRASMEETLDAIDALARHTGRTDGARIFNIHGDWWGGGLYLGGPFPSIANLGVTDEIKRHRPDTKVFLLTRLSRPSAFSHIAGMNGKEYRHAFFLAEERVLDPGSGRVTGRSPRIVQFQQFHDGSTERAWPETSGTKLQVLEELAAHLEYLLDSADLVDELGFATGLLDENTLPPSLGSLTAMLRDAAMYARGDANPAASFLLETLLQAKLAEVPGTIELAVQAGWLPAGFRSASTLFGLDQFASAAFTRIRRGHLTVDEITDYLDGLSSLTAAIAGSLLGGPGAAKLSERMVGHAQWVLRDLSAPLFEAFANAPVRRELLQQWQALRDRLWAEGHAAPSLSEHFGQTLLEQLGLSPGEIQQLDAEVLARNHRLAVDSVGLEDQSRSSGNARNGTNGSPADRLPSAFPSVCPDGFAPPCVSPPWKGRDLPPPVVCPDGSVPPCDPPPVEELPGECNENSGDSCPPAPSGGVLLRTDLVKNRVGNFGELLGRPEQAAYECLVWSGYLAPFILCKKVNEP